MTATQHSTTQSHWQTILLYGWTNSGGFNQSFTKIPMGILRFFAILWESHDNQWETMRMHGLL